MQHRHVNLRCDLNLRDLLNEFLSYLRRCSLRRNALCRWPEIDLLEHRYEGAEKSENEARANQPPESVPGLENICSGLVQIVQNIEHSRTDKQRKNRANADRDSQPEHAACDLSLVFPLFNGLAGTGNGHWSARRCIRCGACRT